MSKYAVEHLNEFFDIDDLPFTQDQKEMVLEWYAQKIWGVCTNTLDWDTHCKHYDPLVIKGDEAHSYVFDFEDGGRSHKFDNLKHLEKLLTSELEREIKFHLERRDE